MTSEDKQPIPPEDAYTELLEDDDTDLEQLIQEAVPEETKTAATSAEAAESQAFIEKLQQEVNVAQQQAQEQEERYLRLFADFENFRRRTQREKEEQGQREKSKFVLEILPVVDNFERAQQQVKLETDRERALHESYQSVYRLLVDCLKKMGVSRLKAVGQPFDPNFHEAIARQTSDEHPEDTVLVEYQAGYKLNDKVIRHAMVSVSAPGASSPDTPAAEEFNPSDQVSVESEPAASAMPEATEVKLEDAPPAESGLTPPAVAPDED